MGACLENSSTHLLFAVKYVIIAEGERSILSLLLLYLFFLRCIKKYSACNRGFVHFFIV